MKTLLLKAPKEVVFEEVPIPSISDDEVLIEVKYCGICGSDIHSYVGCQPYPAGTYLGHEFSGILSNIGENIKGWEIGQRVVAKPKFMCGECWGCRHGRQSLCEHATEHTIGVAPGKEHAGAFAHFVRVPYPGWRLHLLPDDVSFEEGALVEPLACSLHAMRRSDFKPRDTAMVLGCGMIGLGVIAHLKNAGAGLIIATETNSKRAELAKKIGADYVFDPIETPALPQKIKELTGGLGVGLIYDCSGVPNAFASTTDFLRRGGQIIVVGIINGKVEITPADFTLNEFELKGCYTYYADEFPMVIEFLRRHLLPVNELITAKIKLSRIVEDGFWELLKKDSKDIKILVEPD